MAIERENTDLETRQTPEQSATPAKDGGFVENLTKHIRGIATACLGLLGAGEIGCAHTPIVVPHSKMQSERQVCLTWIAIKNGVHSGDLSISEDMQPMISEALQRYLLSQYTNLRIHKLKSLGLFVPDSIGWDYNYSPFPEGIPPIQDNQNLFEENYCDDVIELDIMVVAYGGKDKNEFIIRVNLCSDIYNVEQAKRVGGKREIITETVTLDPNPSNDTQEIATLLRDEVDDLMEDWFLIEYHPERLPSLSPERVERVLVRNFDRFYLKYENTEIPIPESDSMQLKKLARAYLTRFPAGQNADKIIKIIKEVEERPARLAEQKRLQEEAMAKAVAELFENIRMARTAESREDYEEAFRHYSLAKQSGNQVVAAYKEAGIKIPRDIDVLGIEIGEGRYRNGQRIGINTGQPEPSGGEMDTATAIGEGLKFLGAVAIQEAPAIFEAALKTMIFICKNAPGACSPKTPATTYGNGEIEVGVGITSCTDDGIAVKLPYKQETKCTTFTGPSCVIPNLQPGEYEVYAHRLGGCKEQKVGPVKVTVEPNEKIYVDFGRDLK